jgi:hypothetical protein
VLIYAILRKAAHLVDARLCVERLAGLPPARAGSIPGRLSIGPVSVAVAAVALVGLAGLSTTSQAWAESSPGATPTEVTEAAVGHGDSGLHTATSVTRAAHATGVPSTSTLPAETPSAGRAGAAAASTPAAGAAATSAPADATPVVVATTTTASTATQPVASAVAKSTAVTGIVRDSAGSVAGASQSASGVASVVHDSTGTVSSLVSGSASSVQAASTVVPSVVADHTNGKPPETSSGATGGGTDTGEARKPAVTARTTSHDVAGGSTGHSAASVTASGLAAGSSPLPPPQTGVAAERSQRIEGLGFAARVPSSRHAGTLLSDADTHEADSTSTSSSALSILQMMTLLGLDTASLQPPDSIQTGDLPPAPTTRTKAPSAPAPTPPPPSAPVPGGAVAGGSSGLVLMLFTSLAALIVCGAQQTRRRLRLASQLRRLAPVVLIPERPG